MNSLKSIFARIQTNQSGIDALEAINISLNNIDGSAKSSYELLEEVANKWDELSDSQRRNTAVGVAGIYQLSRFNAMMLNWESGVEATTSALNSQGSAMREQEKYNESLEARINRLNTAWYNLSNTVGNTILSDTIVLVTDLMTKFTDAGEDGVKSLSVLPPIMVTIGVGLLMVSTRFKNLAVSVATNTGAMLKTSVAMTTTSVSAQTLAFSLLRVGTALKGIMLATGVGAVFLGIGVAIEKLTKAYADNVKQQEAMRLENEKNIKALTDDKERTEELLETYLKMNEAKAKGVEFNTAKEQEYLDIQRELGELFPALVKEISATGDVRLKSADAIEKELQLTRELIKAKNDLTLAEAKSTFEDRLEQINSAYQQIAKNQKEIDDLQSLLESPKTDGMVGFDAEKLRKNKAELELELKSMKLNIFNLSQEISGSILDISKAFTDMDIPSNLADDIEEIIQSLDFEGLSDVDLVNFSKELATLQDAIVKSAEAGNQLEYDKAVESLDELFASTKNYKTSLIELIPTLTEYQNELDLIAQKNEFANTAIDDSEAILSAFEKRLTDLTGSVKDYADSAEMLAGVTEAGLENTNELLTTYSLLTDRLSDYTDEELLAISEGKNLTAVEREIKGVMDQRRMVMESLQLLYPSLMNLQSGQISLTNEQIKAVENENNVNRILHETYKNVYAGKYNAEQQMTLASAEGTKARIENANSEIRALRMIVDSYESMYSSLTKQPGLMTSDPEVAMFLEREAGRAKVASARIKEVELSIADLKTGLSSTYKDLDNFNKALADGKGGSSSKKATSKEDLKEYIYLSNTYKLAIEKVNAEIDKQVMLRAESIEGTDKFTKSLETQKKLEADKLALMKAQAESLNSQILANNIVEYGRVESGSQKTVSERKQMLEEASSELLSLQQDILKQEQALREIETNIVNSNMSAFSSKRSERDQAIALENVRLKELSTTSNNYNKSLETMNKAMKDKQNLNRQELEYLNKVIKEGKLQDKSMQEVTDRVTELKLEMRELTLEIQDMNFEIVVNVKTQFDNYKSEVEHELAKLNLLQERQIEGSANWNKIQSEKIELQKQESIIIRDQIDALQKEITLRDLSASKIEEIKREIQGLTLAYYESINAEQELANSLTNTQDKVATEIADALWKAYQSYIKERKEDHMKQLQLEAKAEQDAHNANIKRLNDELTLFKRNAQERLSLLDKEEADRSFSMDMGDLASEREKVSAEMDRLALSDSREDIKRRKELQETLDKIDREMSEKQRKRDLDLQKQALSDLINTKDEEINKQISLENERYDAVTKTIDREKDYWEKHYSELESDERKHARLRENIMTGNWENITSEFGKYIGQMQATMPNLADTMDGTMKSVGTSIRENVITSLQEAIQLMKEFRDNQSLVNASPGTPSSSQSVGSVGSANVGGVLSSGDMKVLMAKYMVENLAPNEVDKITRGFIESKAYALANQGRAEGSKILPTVDLSTYLSQLNKSDLETLSKYIGNNASLIVDSPHLQEYLKEFAKRLLLSSARLSSGGMTPNFGGGGIDGMGGRGIIVHPNEIVNNPLDSARLLEMSKGLEVAYGYIRPLLDKINAFGINPQSMTGGDGLNVIFQVDTMIANEETATSFGNTITDIWKNKFGRR